MIRTVPFDTSEYCDICNIKGAYDFMGDYLCEKCYRDDVENEYLYDDEIFGNEEFHCQCSDCKCGKKYENVL